MANDYDDKAKNAMLDQLATVMVRVALHTGDPGGADSAANELTGGSPAYARKPVAWGGAAAGVITATGSVVFDVPPATTVSWISYWNSAGTSRYSKKNVTDEVFAGQGTYTLTTETHDLNDP